MALTQSFIEKSTDTSLTKEILAKFKTTRQAIEGLNRIMLVLTDEDRDSLAVFIAGELPPNASNSLTLKYAITHITFANQMYERLAISVCKANHSLADKALSDFQRSYTDQINILNKIKAPSPSSGSGHRQQDRPCQP
jgi:hypothetical protein